MALRPPCRMGPPLRSSAADAHYCIMVQIPRIYRIQVCGAMLRAQLASAPQIVPNTEAQHHTREQSELPRLALDGKIPIQVVAGGGQNRVAAVAVAALEVIAAQAVLGLDVADDRLDRGAAFHLAADRSGHPAHLAGDPHPELLFVIVAAIALVDVD